MASLHSTVPPPVFIPNRLLANALRTCREVEFQQHVHAAFINRGHLNVFPSLHFALMAKGLDLAQGIKFPEIYPLAVFIAREAHPLFLKRMKSNGEGFAMVDALRSTESVRPGNPAYSTIPPPHLVMYHRAPRALVSSPHTHRRTRDHASTRRVLASQSHVTLSSRAVT
ncbi:hypothetical protein FISHEDRAFT_68673 [Fistulina hepatica ATCC 64428]|uniref:Uncharacterized protein n=1 Tax=Fistulina hepatica ATCC 64428 TaxID=1128425 RepID=A0A0D7AQQ4_9AGAR|nr:hypothetical protein FISHEDRAFT_68673 [Fistulina hepatica ATCC 64428]